MTKLIALVAAGAFAAGTMFAGEHGDCAKKAGNEGKMACTASLATLNLTADQKTKMETAMAEHHKAGCTDATEAKFMNDAKGILTPEQFAKFKAECKKEKAGAWTRCFVNGGRRRYYLQEIMVALASAGATCVHALLSLRAL
jgi:Spy/CpxP family protein refolding chaperone